MKVKTIAEDEREHQAQQTEEGNHHGKIMITATLDTFRNIKDINGNTVGTFAFKAEN